MASLGGGGAASVGDENTWPSQWRDRNIMNFIWASLELQQMNQNPQISIISCESGLRGLRGSRWGDTPLDSCLSINHTHCHGENTQLLPNWNMCSEVLQQTGLNLKLTLKEAHVHVFTQTSPGSCSPWLLVPTFCCCNLTPPAAVLQAATCIHTFGSRFLNQIPTPPWLRTGGERYLQLLPVPAQRSVS